MLGQPCSSDSADYVSPGPNGQEFITTVIRHNCRTPQLFCNINSNLCESTKPLGSQCGYDQECQSVRTAASTTKTRGRFPILNFIQVQLRIPEQYLYPLSRRTQRRPGLAIHPDHHHNIPRWVNSSPSPDTQRCLMRARPRRPVMITALGTLVFIHKRQRLRRHQALRDYYFEQMELSQIPVTLAIPFMIADPRNRLASSPYLR